jgi:hypothetical protein
MVRLASEVREVGVPRLDAAQPEAALIKWNHVTSITAGARWEYGICFLNSLIDRMTSSFSFQPF